MKRHPLDAVTLVALAFVLVAGALWGMWYAGWEPATLAVAAPLLLVALGTVGLVATLIAARQAGRRQREQRTAVAPPTTLDPTPGAAEQPDDDDPAENTDTVPADTLTLEDLTRSSDDREDPR
ncbi:hypothetical protein KV102_03235 [Mumia sp. zg.B53]|uniref:hypothetical protein n=1 Tax=unclassified Mumia TaxID=2621872 RepID=UPI001C6EC9D4|nr:MULTISPECIES: hypothetical protein [unclassified Mumia]MBW9204759.1 hypothetical protein [Mumia sp. zg.B17]MBW9209236.1 hypothetical protein [Mumia sp. zg.B21]MBW9213846.1 hypothetical protein [Mumia sp. zg.B53]MDD9349227.1 hypothetical protein [Mumia sp.]